MKSSSNNEMDVLLRSLAKRAPSVSQAGDGEQQATGHLDADELNAFAERALPLAARAKYMTHLVDCSRCRKLVAELSAAAGAPVAEVKAETAQKSFWQRLPEFLSPQVLRFAVPALVILAVITAGVITFDRQGFVARRVEPTEADPLSDTQSSPSADQEQPAGNTYSRVEPTQNTAPGAEKQSKAGDNTNAADKATTVDSTSEFLAKDAPKPSKAGEEAQPTFAPEPVPPPVASPQVEAKPQAAARPQVAAQPQVAAKSEGDKNDAVTKQKAMPAVRVAEPESRETRDERAADDGERSRSRKAAALGRGGAAAVQSAETRRNEAEQAKRADEDDNSIAVAGRRFRKQGNIWIDVAYSTSRPAITVVRGSEQYRALVADEPGIGTIAAKLAGEVIVVWKGRAYRIR